MYWSVVSGELSKDEYEEEMFSYSHKKPSITNGQSLLKKRVAEAEIIGSVAGKE